MDERGSLKKQLNILLYCLAPSTRHSEYKQRSPAFVSCVFSLPCFVFAQELINQGRQKVIEATNALKSLSRESLEDIISRVVRSLKSLSIYRSVVITVCFNDCCLSPQWKENPALTENQVQAVALGRQATVELELKRREAIYRDVLNRQQSVRATLYTRQNRQLNDANKSSQ